MTTAILVSSAGVGQTQEDASQGNRPLSVEEEVIDQRLLEKIEGGQPDAGALSLRAVLRSVRNHHPKVESTRAKLQALESQRFAAEGVYDPLFSGKGSIVRGGYYETNVADAELRQYLGVWGTEIYGGYRVGVPIQGDRYPTYESSETLNRGEVRGGVSVPLWRDGPIDPRRTALEVTQSLEKAGGFELRDAELNIRLEAIAAYFDWLAAGHQLDIAERLLALAETRRQQVSAQRDAGSASDFEVTDSRQMELNRRAAVITAEQKLRSASIQLSLYLRTDTGQPMAPARAALPPFRAAPQEVLSLDVANLAECHPQVRALSQRIEAARSQAELADNRVAPEARAKFEVSRDLGNVGGNADLAGTNVKLGVGFQIPLLLRKGRGQSDAAEAELRSLRHEISWLRDRMRASAQKVAINQRAALNQTQVERDLVAATETLAEGERYRLNAGDSTMLVVNLREMAVAQAATKLVYALAELHTMQATIEELNRLRCD